MLISINGFDNYFFESIYFFALAAEHGRRVRLRRAIPQGLEKIKTQKYDYILMDIHMPILNGFETAKTIRTQNGLNKNTTIFAMTADIFSKDEKLYNSFFDDFLWKPIEIDTLFEAMVKYI